MCVHRESGTLFKFCANQSHLTFTFTFRINKTITINCLRTCSKLLNNIGSFFSQYARHRHYE